jgi:hypothetical protein
VSAVREYRAYDTTTEWSGPVRQGGYGSAIVVTRDPEASGRIVDLEGQTVWPPDGRSCGAARWVQS